MLARVKSGAVVGIDAVVVEVEVDMSLGLPFFNVVGLPEGAAKESKVRVIAALKNAGFDIPQKRITVNLAPADIKKEGAAFELPIAIGVLAAAGVVPAEAVADCFFSGELSLDGSIKPIRGALPLAVAAKTQRASALVIPQHNAAEASLVEGFKILPAAHLAKVVKHLCGEESLSPYRGDPICLGTAPSANAPDMAEVKGQGDLKNALELAAAGGHNVLLCGPPGSGKSMLARRLSSILPRMTHEEALEVTKIYSVTGLLNRTHALISERPFRSPHHTISNAGLVGGGNQARPGELSLAHHGVLFLDELPEFQKHVLEVLRQPLEEGSVHLARANQHISYPCQVMLVAAMNPCPCGYYNVPGRSCSCPQHRVQAYQLRVSGPLMDRIDITLQARPVEVSDWDKPVADEKPSAWYRARVEEARERQRRRFSKEEGIHCNAQMNARLLREHAQPDASANQLLRRAVELHRLSARAHDRILKLARTRADLEGHSTIQNSDMALAIDCRLLDREDWRQQGNNAASPQNSPHLRMLARSARQVEGS